MEAIANNGDGLSTLASRLTKLSIQHKIDPIMEFDWPETLPEDRLWMPEELMTIYGTEASAELSDCEKLRLSKTESLWFYSFNVHGERHLLRDVLECMHTPGYEHISDYMHHFVGEENVHSWFFSTFCKKYGGKVYPDRRISFQVQKNHPDVEAFYIFSRILILEEVLDYYNIKIGNDESIHPIIRKINNIHHFEESRHVAFGRSLITILFEHLKENHSSEVIKEAQDYINRYISWCLDSIYNPIQYIDAGIPEPYDFRNRVMNDPARELFHQKLTAKVRKFFQKTGALEKDV